jgi:hypothetical protein
MRKKFSWLAVLLLVGALSASASMVQLTTDELANNATLIVTGTVERVESYPPDGSGVIYSEAEVRVRDAVKGANEAEFVTVRYMGGEYEGLAMVVMEEPAFALGEDVVLFLAPVEDEVYKCPDGVQGKLAVVDGTVLPVGKTLTEYLDEVAAAAGR